LAQALAGLPRARASSRASVLRSIAHAGGAIDDKTHANSIAALDENSAKGFVWFELDFQWTVDGELVCGHDWGPTLQRNDSLVLEQPPTSAESAALFAGHPHAPCTIPALARWLAEHRQARLVTDLKERPMDGLAVLAEQIPDHARRLIAQVYQPEQSAQALALGYRDIIWTLYRYPGTTLDVIRQLASIQPMAVTMDEQRLVGGLGLVLQRAGVPVYVHTINDPEQARRYAMRWGVSGLYTDTLAPLKAETMGDAPEPMSESVLH